MFDTFGQYLLTNIVNNFNLSYLILSMISSSFIALLYYYCLKNYNNIGIINGIINVISIIITSFFISYLIMKDKYTLLQIIGLILVSVGGILLIPFK